MQWDTLDVPLENGWRCTLHPAWQYRRVERELGRSWSSGGADRWTRDGALSFSFPNNDTWRAEDDARRQRELDKRDFERYFRPRLDKRTITGRRELNAIRSFLSEALDVVHWNLPVDNDGIVRALRDAVASGRLVPVIDRERHAVPRVVRRDPAPERWPSSGGGFSGAGGFGRGKWAAFEKAGPGLLVFNGEPVLRGPYDPATREGQLKAARAEMASMAKWVANGVFTDVYGSGDGEDNGRQSLAESFAGDAEPFEYSEDVPTGDALQTAWLPIDGGPPNTWVENPSGSGQLRFYDADGNAAVDIDCDHDHGFGNPHWHKWTNGARDKGNPMSAITY